MKLRIACKKWTANQCIWSFTFIHRINLRILPFCNEAELLLLRSKMKRPRTDYYFLVWWRTADVNTSFLSLSLTVRIVFLSNMDGFQATQSHPCLMEDHRNHVTSNKVFIKVFANTFINSPKTLLFTWLFWSSVFTDWQFTYHRAQTGHLIYLNSTIPL